MERDFAGRIELHYAALEGLAAEIREAISEGQDLSVADDAGFTPLHFAAQLGQAEIATMLVEAGAALEARNKFGNTPLWVAFMNSHVNDGQGVITALIRAGASVDATTDSGVSPRDLAERIANYDLERFLPT